MNEVIAVYGGSFDPPHVAHTLVAAYVLSAHPVDRLLVVPTAQHPFEKRLTAFEHRVHMCELAMSDLRRVDISTVEQELEGPSLTLHMLRELARRHPAAQLRLVIGSDLLAETPGWHAFDEVRALAPPIIVGRSGHAYDEDGEPLPELPDVSSTEVRRRLRAGISTDGLLNPKVAAYVREHGLYREPSVRP
ncbi:MAG: nicotinate (nicotinamide) nucleotide adenylyltransferase [Myxococcales bacterium]|nr:nicotinate (nicotinamide) nucleotide adenylyltransferase [Myxococcales bacterium]